MTTLQRVDQIIAEIHRQMKQPNFKPQTSLGVEHRADRLRSMATSVKLNGGKVKPDYEYD